MPLSDERAVEQARILKRYHDSEREVLDIIRRYWRGRQPLPAVVPSAAPQEVRTMARLSRVNICAIVIDSLAQSTFVDGFRGRNDADNHAVWKVWQANRMDARQTGIHRAAFAYGAAYAVVLPGDPEPVIRGASPRNMTAVYGEDPDWPIWALERLGNGLWRLYDDEASYYLVQRKGGDDFDYIETREHGLPVTPVVRYLDEHDLDADDDVEADPRLRFRFGEDVPMRGQVAPMFTIQDQVDLTTFGLLVAQHYSAFRQRWAIGWIAPSEKQLLQKMVGDSEGEEDTEELRKQAAAAAQAARMKAGASQLWTFDEDPDDMKLGEFSETNLKGFLESREASLRHGATLSQTPVHELTGQLINMAAEALAAAEAGKDRKVNERETSLGESHEQMFWLAGKAKKIDVPTDAQVVWRDTSARAFSATVDALGKLASLLKIPPQELWERVPGATQQDIARWKKAAEEGDAFGFLGELLDRQGSNGGGPAPAPTPTPPG